MTEHFWVKLASFTEDEIEPSLSINIEWCSVCGTIKQGPFSEPGAYNYYLYFGVGPKGKYPGPPWSSEPAVHPYDENRQDPPCGRWTMDSKGVAKLV